LSAPRPLSPEGGIADPFVIWSGGAGAPPDQHAHDHDPDGERQERANSAAVTTTTAITKDTQPS
jgi:hypothetical protein